ncbi:MAG: ABC transporter permease [Solirubrobacterales bacterium]|nr:ABC transporter permease [Solirubrobacterales bacterium]
MRKITLRGLMARKLRLALTALAIVIGVTFVTGTLVLGDTLNRTFNNLIGNVYQHVSFEIRGQAAFKGNSPADVIGTADRKPVPASIAAEVRRLSGVAYVFGTAGGYAQLVARDGSSIDDGTGKDLGFAFDPNQQLSPFRLVAGRAPTSAQDVVIDKATATKYHYSLGDPVRVLLPDGARTFKVAGMVTFGNDDTLAGDTLAGFAQSTAQSLFHSRGHYDAINVLAAPGADEVALQQAITRLLPAGVEVVSGQAVANQLSSAVDNELSFLSTALLIFALISLFVGGFTIFNTFTITVGQRTRELALLRVVGASRRQLRRSVLGEAAVIGLGASLIGLGLGVVAALGLKALLGAFGISLPSAPLVFEARTVVVALAVGVGVTVISAVVPARRAVRIPPVAALAEHGEDEIVAPRRRRVRAGVVLGLSGTVAVLAGVSGANVKLVGLGSVAVLVARALLAPLAARPLAGVLGRPLRAMFGTPGRIGRENSMRNPQRTAQTSAALMIGIGLVSTIAVLGASLSSSASHQVDSAVNADYLITSSGAFSRSVPAAVSRLPGVTATTTVYRGQFEVRRSLSSLAAVTPANLPQTVNLHVIDGSGEAALAAGQLLVDATTARTDHLHVGSTVPVRFAQTGPADMRIGGIYETNPLIGSYVTGERFFVANFDNPLPGGVLVKAAPGVSGLGAQLNQRLAAYPNLTIQTRAQFESQQKANINQLLGLVYVLLALAVVIALIGIVNTLLLSVFERTREIGLLRAVGMRRGQVKAMIRSEAVIVALVGAVIGVVVGTGLGLALASALRNSGVTNVAVPVPSLVAFVVLSAILGLIAATWPARRAAKLDVLRAIAAE